MSKTPRTDAAAECFVQTGVASELIATSSQLEHELFEATRGRCQCSECGKTVNNAWRDQDGHYCLTCLAKQRDGAELVARRYRAIRDTSGRGKELDAAADRVLEEET